MESIEPWIPMTPAELAERGAPENGFKLVASAPETVEPVEIQPGAGSAHPAMSMLEINPVEDIAS